MVDGDCAWPDRFAQSGDTAIALDSAASTLTLFVGDQSHQLPVRVDSESSAVVMSTDGGIVGWVSAARVDGRQDIVLWDATEGIEWKRVQAPTPDVLNLEGIDASGRVYLTSVGDPNRAIADRVWVWPSSEDGGFLRVVGLGDFVTVADVTPDGLAVLKTLEGGGDAAWPEEPPLSGVAVWGRVTRHGDFVLGRAAEVQSVVWAPDRSRYLALSSLTVVEQTNYGRTEVEIQLPTDVQIAGDPSWESNVQLLVPVTANEGTADLLTVLRCSVVFGRCEAAASGSQDVALPGGDVDNMS
ncbi:MAG TPA: hypothetical protein VFG63_02280 [Nocardioidaceae bacterium]|nr:hypothetical protein [Nocardioidaceae bacterium]